METHSEDANAMAATTRVTRSVAQKLSTKFKKALREDGPKKVLQPRHIKIKLDSDADGESMQHTTKECANNNLVLDDQLICERKPDTSEIFDKKKEMFKRSKIHQKNFGKEPDHWMEVLNNIREMRKNRDSPVDTMGCDKLCDDDILPEVSRAFYFPHYCVLQLWQLQVLTAQLCTKKSISSDKKILVKLLLLYHQFHSFKH